MEVASMQRQHYHGHPLPLLPERQGNSQMASFNIP